MCASWRLHVPEMKRVKLCRLLKCLMHTLIFLRLSILKEDFKNEPQERHCSHFTSVIALQGEYAVWKGHTVKYDPGEMLLPGMYRNPRNKGETFQSCCFSESMSSGSGGYLMLRHSLQMWAFTVTSTGLIPSTRCWSRREERLNPWWYHYRAKTERSACKTGMCWLACISHNSQALTARCFCPGSFLCSLLPLWYPLWATETGLFSWGSSNMSPLQTTSSLRKETESRI